MCGAVFEPSDDGAASCPKEPGGITRQGMAVKIQVGNGDVCVSPTSSMSHARRLRQLGEGSSATVYSADEGATAPVRGGALDDGMASVLSPPD